VNALAVSTAKQYDSHMRYFVRFCVLYGITDELRGPSESALIRFVAFCARTAKHVSCVQYLKGIKSYYRDHGHSDFAAPGTYRALYRVLKGVRRSGAGGVTRKCAITPEMLSLYLAKLIKHQPFAAATRACVLVAFFGFFRKSNVATATDAPWTTTHCLRVMDIEFLAAEYALRITVRRTKTVQFGERDVVVHIAGLAGNVLDPVAAWLDHIRASAPGSVLPAFAWAHEGRHAPYTQDYLVGAAKAMATMGGVDPASVSGHSFRRGGATFAFLAGVDDLLIQQQGDWRSIVYRAYITVPAKVALRTTSEMLRVAATGQCAGRIVPAVEPFGHLGVPCADAFGIL